LFLNHLSPTLGSFVAAAMDSYETPKVRYPTCVVFPSKLRENFIDMPSSWPYKWDKNDTQPAHKNTSLHCSKSGMEKRYV